MDASEHVAAPEYELLLSLRRPQMVMERAAGVALASQGHPTVRGHHRALLRLLHERPHRIGELADRVAVTKQSMTTAIEQLDRNGYVTISADPADQRAKVVQLTPRGEQAEAIVRATLAQLAERWRASVGEDAMRRLGELLAQLNAVLSTEERPAI